MTNEQAWFLIVLAWALLALTPRLLVQTPRGYLNEHQFYVPLIGCVIALTALWDEWMHLFPSTGARVTQVATP